MIDVQLTDNQTIQYIPSEDFFDSPALWIAQPVLAFSSWLSGQPLANSTRIVRSAMWGKFLRYLDSFEISLVQCEPHHVSGFLNHFNLDKEQGWRYVRLIERVYNHLIILGLNIPNPAQHAGQSDVHTRQNDPMRFLDKKEKQNLENCIYFVLQEAAQLGSATTLKRQKGRREYTKIWVWVRDATVAAVLVGAGLKVSEAVRLSVNCTSDSEMLIVQRAGYKLERHIPLMPLAIEALRAWLPYRATESNLGPVLFPALVSRRRDDQHILTSTMHPTTLFRRVSLLLKQAGITDARACAQTLRNTYAADLIDSGANDEMIFEAMGYVGDYSVSHLRGEYERFMKRRTVD